MEVQQLMSSEHPPVDSIQDLKPAKHTEMMLRINMLIFEEFLELFELKTPLKKRENERLWRTLSHGESPCCPLAVKSSSAATTKNPNGNNHTTIVDFSFSFVEICYSYITFL